MSRPIGTSPRIVGKPLEGQEGTPQHERAEAMKLELQRVIQMLTEASDKAQEDIRALQVQGGSAAGLHPFFLSGA